MKNNKVGIMSFWDSSENYGQLLQVFATTSILKKEGYDPYLINYQGNKDTTLNHQSNKTNKLFCLRQKFKQAYKLILHPNRLKSYIQVINNPSTKFIQINKARKFDEFKSEHFKLTKLYHNFSELKNDSPDFGAYITGSDMVWFSQHIADPYYLKFGNSNVKRIAYAPSFGKNSLPDEYMKVLPKLIENIDFISTREKSGKDIINQVTNRQVFWAPDPTLLLSSDDYAKISSNNISDSSYVFCYFLGNSIKLKMKTIEKYARTKNLSIKYSSANNRADDYPKIYPTIGEWLELINKATYIFTNSFHGVVFSIIFQKKFLYVPLHYYGVSTNERAYSLLEKLGLKERIWNNDLSDVEKPIDYFMVNQELDKWRHEASDFLKNALR